jgi:hypothetical protein
MGVFCVHVVVTVFKNICISTATVRHVHTLNLKSAIYEILVCDLLS